MPYGQYYGGYASYGGGGYGGGYGGGGYGGYGGGGGGYGGYGGYGGGGGYDGYGGYGRQGGGGGKSVEEGDQRESYTVSVVAGFNSEVQWLSWFRSTSEMSCCCNVNLYCRVSRDYSLFSSLQVMGQGMVQ